MRAFEAEQNVLFKLEGYEENFNEILAAMQSDTKQSRTTGILKYRDARDAYMDVVLPKLADKRKIDEQELRKKFIEEQKKSPKSLSVDETTGTKRVRAEGEDPITDAIVSSIRNLKR